MKIGIAMSAAAWGDVGPEAFEKGVAGREGALLHVSKNLAEMGHQVTAFVRRPDHVRVDGKDGGYHEYIPYDAAAVYFTYTPYDAVIAWELPQAFKPEAIRKMQPRRVVHFQVAHVDPPHGMELPHASRVAVLSEWAGQLMLHDEAELSPDQIVVTPNGVELELYPWDDDHEARRLGPNRFFYSSSPDRGLYHLLGMWPRFKALMPDAELHIAYGARKWAEVLQWSHGREGEVALQVLRGLDLPGVVDHGLVGRRELAEIQLSCKAMLYPADSMQPTETGCITAVEAGAAGAPMFLTNCDCLPSEFGGVAHITKLPLDHNAYINDVMGVLGNSSAYARMREAGRRLAEERSWQQISRTWEDLLTSIPGPPLS